MMLRYMPLLLIVLLLVACPYESTVPLPHEGALPVDPNLVGVWNEEAPGDRAPIRVEILAYSGTDYLVEFRDQDGQVSRLRAYAVDLDGARLLNVQSIEELERDRGWLFFDYGIADDELRIRAVSDEIVNSKANKPSDLQSILKQHLKTPGFFEESTVFTRQEPPA